MGYQTIEVEAQGPAAVVRLNRPEKRNAISFPMMDEIESALAVLARDNTVRGIVITGGDAYFSSGVDLNAMRDVASQSQFMDYLGHWRRLNEAIENNAKPVIAAIEGFCLTGALELALACDLRVGARGAQFGITSSKIGTVPGAGGTQRLPRIVGIANAFDLMFSADPIDAERAYEIGLLNRLTPKGGAMTEATKMIGVYAQRAPLSLRYIKNAVYGGMQMPLSDAIKYEAFVVSTVYETDDKQEGVRSFLEKRTPQFAGR